MVSIKTKLTALVSACVLLTATVLGGLSIIRLNSMTKKNSQDNLRLICVAEKEHLDIIMGNIQQSVSNMRDIIFNFVRDFDTLVNDELYRYDITKRIETVFYTIAYHTEGAVSFYLRYSPELVSTECGFLWSKNGRRSSFSELSLTDMAQYTEDDTEHVGWYYVPVNNGKPTWMKPYLNKNLGIYMISYIVPLFSSGVPIGVVGMDIDFSTLANTINSSNVYKNGFAYILDENKAVVYHHDYEPGTAEVAADKKLLGYSLPLSNGWEITIAAPKKEINAERNRLIRMISIATVCIALLFICISIKITEGLLRPLIELTAATKKIAEGDLDVQLSSTSNDEIGILAESFRKTVRHLPEYMYRDSLTRVHNATAYKRSIARLEERMISEMLSFGIIVMDVNNLKRTNDSFGHEAGNLLIVATTKLICTIFSHSPVFRIGGDEFVIILENDDFKKRNDLLQKFDEAMTLETLALPEGGTLPVSVAHGMSVYNADTDSSFAEVFNRADAAMYRNKQAVKRKANSPESDYALLP